MLKIFNIDPSVQDFQHLYELKNSPRLENNYFEKTLTGVSSTEVLDLKKHSSWTHKQKFMIGFTKEIYDFFDHNKIVYGKESYGYDKFSLLKYETNDFFLDHRDTKLPDETTYDGIK
jgi:hypothetical protein